MKTLLYFFFFFSALYGQAQSTIKGQLYAVDSTKLELANVGLFLKSDTTLIKVEVTDQNGNFSLNGLSAGVYFLKSTYVGLPNLVVDEIQLKEGQELNLGKLYFSLKSLNVVEISTERRMIEVKADRTIFNVQGTINSTGANALNLLRKAPSVTVDNNDNINVMGRSGVKVYIDGKKLPLNGDDLSNYLKNMPANQIDRIEIITTPGAKYDAEGNAGIIDIRLKKNKNIGANGSLSSTLTKGILTRYSLNASGNYRNEKMNIFGGAGYSVNDNFHNIMFKSYQNGIYLDEINNTQNNRNAFTYRLGSDFYLSKKHTLGFLVNGSLSNGEEISYNEIALADAQNITAIDSVLIAKNSGLASGNQSTFNVNYGFRGKKNTSLLIDIDYGSYDNQRTRQQPNLYYDSAKEVVLSKIENAFNTPIDISIYTAKLDYETAIKKGQLGLGGKFGRVSTRNVFEVFDVVNAAQLIDSSRSNRFNYDENVYAGYVSYNRPLGEKWKMISGVRVEQTIATGELTTLNPNLQEDPIKLNYLNVFPNAGLTWQVKPKSSLAINYGRRINRPNYNVLNPFRNQLSELSIEKGNPNLKPEIVNNVELGYTYAYMYNFKLGYSVTTDKITRLIGPDDTKPQAGFISWDNLATQSVLSFNASLPFKIKKWWSAYFNAGLSYMDNQANYGGDAIVDVQTFSYMIYSQHTFKLIKGIKAEISGYYSGPGIWGGTFVYESNWSLSAGLQRSFLKKKLKAKLNVNNIFNRVGWYGSSTFNGLTSTGNGRWDSRFISLSLSYNFGNQNIKSKKHKTGLESESKRIK